MTDWSFFLVIVAAYAAACGAWLLAFRLMPAWWWPRKPVLSTDRKWLDLALVFVAAASILGIGQLWRLGWLLPEPDGWLGAVAWNVNNLIIYAPLVLILAARAQSSETVYLSTRGLPVKVIAGLVLGAIAVTVFLLLRGDLPSLGQVAADSVRGRNLRHFLPVFLEGAALACAFVRVRWAFGLWLALVAPGILFAAAHIPRQLQAGLGAVEMAAYFTTTAAVTAVVLYTLERSADIVWLGLVHYLMDVAIGAFE